MQEIAEGIKYFRDAGLLPIGWIIAGVVILNKFPKMRVALINAFFSPIAGEAKRRGDSATSTEAIHRHLVAKDDCHEAMGRIDKELADIHNKIDEKFTETSKEIGAMNKAIGSLEGYLRGRENK
jgi:hypothetical protein